MTDARQLARHLLWAATTPAAFNQAFNVVNGDVFRWSWMWGRLAEWFDLEPAPFDGSIVPLEEQMKADAPIWRRIAAREGWPSRILAVWHPRGTRMPILDGRSRS